MFRLSIAALAAVPYLIVLLPAYLVVAVPLLVCSAVAALARRFEPDYLPWPALMEFEEGLGWKPRPWLDTHYLADYDDIFSVVTDGDGWPGRRSVEDSDVIVVGDSFVFGYGVNAGRSFADRNPGMRVKAIGAPGYSMVHGVLLMARLAPRLRSKHVVWFVYPENDLQDNLAPEMRGYRAPFLRCDARSGEWRIAGRHVSPAPWRCSDQDRRRLFPRLCVAGPFADRAYAAAEHLIARAAATCRSHGARLTVVTIPHPMQLTAAGRVEMATRSGAAAACDAGLPDRRLAEMCTRQGVPMVAGIDHLTRRDYKRREGIHWNQRGHRRMAKVLRTVVAADGREPSAANAASKPLALRAPSPAGPAGSRVPARRPDYSRSHD